MRYHLWILLVVFVSLSCGNKEEDVAVISTPLGGIEIVFFPEVAPRHVESFLTHARNGYFDGTTFHRVIPGFVIQGGDPNSRDEDRSNAGSGGHAARFFGIGDEKDPESWTLPAEFNALPHTRGTVSMARAQDINSAGSQFYICVGDVRRLDNKYTVFGEVIEGLEVVDKIVAVQRDKRDNPLEKIPMQVTVLTKRNIQKRRMPD